MPLPVFTFVVDPVVLASDFRSAGSGSAPRELTYKTARLLSTCVTRTIRQTDRQTDRKTDRQTD